MGIVRRVVFGVIGLLLLALGAWLRGGAAAGTALAQAEFDAAPKAEGAAGLERVRPENQGRLVLVQGTPTLRTAARDDSGKVITESSLVLMSTIERWAVRTRRENGRDQTTAGWEGSSGGQRWYADATLGAFEIDPQLLDGVDTSAIFELDAATLERLAPKQQLGANQVFFGTGTPDAPDSGDLRVAYTHAPLTPISVLARQNGTRLERYVRENDGLFPVAFPIGVARSGIHDAKSMSAAQRAQIDDSASTPRILGLAPLIGAGWLAVGALGVFGKRRSVGVRFAQGALLVVWIFMGMLLAPLERAAAGFSSDAIVLAAASALGTAALAAVLVLIHRAIETR